MSIRIASHIDEFDLSWNLSIRNSKTLRVASQLVLLYWVFIYMTYKLLIRVSVVWLTRPNSLWPALLLAVPSIVQNTQQFLQSPKNKNTPISHIHQLFSSLIKIPLLFNFCRRCFKSGCRMVSCGLLVSYLRGTSEWYASCPSCTSTRYTFSRSCIII